MTDWGTFFLTLIIIPVVVNLISQLVIERGPSLARRIVRLAAYLVPRSQRERYRIEWLAELQQLEHKNASMLFLALKILLVAPGTGLAWRGQSADHAPAPPDSLSAAMSESGSTSQLLGGRYEIRRTIGTGEMTTVLEGWDRHTGRRVALKVPIGLLARDDWFLARLQHEVSTVVGFTHPNVSAIHALERDSQAGFVVVELVDGPSLRDMLAARGTLPPVSATRIAAQVCAALAVAHSHGLTHGHLTPANVLLGIDGCVKLTDFRLAQAARPMGAGPFPAADLQGLGRCLAAMLTGQEPTEGEPIRLGPNVPADLARIIARAAGNSKDGETYDSAANLGSDLERHLDYYRPLRERTLERYRTSGRRPPRRAPLPPNKLPGEFEAQEFVQVTPTYQQGQSVSVVMRDNSLHSRRYEVLRPIEAGTTATVLEAWDRRDYRRVALKIPIQELAGDPTFLKRLEREVQAAASLVHPNIAAVYGVGRDARTRFVVTELVHGSSLQDMLIDRGRLPAVGAARIASSVCAALAAAHACGVTHGHLTLSNVLLTIDGQVKVTDFRLAQANRPSDTVADPASDLAGLGCCLAAMLTGQVPAATGPIRLGPEVPAELGAIVERMTGDLQSPYEAAAYLARDLDGFLIRSSPLEGRPGTVA
jgi:serine/threonine protein kinase